MKIEALIAGYRERPTAFNGFWMFIAEVTGVMESHCRKRHQQHHTIHPIQYDGTAVVSCSRCPRQFYRK